MALPAVGADTHIVVALIAELRLVAVAIEAEGLQQWPTIARPLISNREI